MRPEVLVYDCDGVLFRSHRANLAYYNRIFREFELPEIAEDDRQKAHICHTAASPVVLETLMPKELVQPALLFLETLDYREFIPFMDPFPGMMEALETLSAQLPLAMATNRGHSVARVLETFEIAPFFREVVSSRDVERPKPAPDMLFRVAERLGTDADKLLFVGDSELDWLAAKAAGVSFVGFGRGFEGSDQVVSHRELTDLVLERLSLDV